MYVTVTPLNYHMETINNVRKFTQEYIITLPRRLHKTKTYEMIAKHVIEFIKLLLESDNLHN